LGFQEVFRIRSEETLPTHYRGGQGTHFETIIIGFVGGITRAHSQSLGGAQPPKGCHPELQGSDLQSDSYQEVPRDQGAQFGTVSRRICRV
jgi:hypothetical protein